MKKVLGKIFTVTLSLIGFCSFLFAVSTFASYYIDAFGYTFYSNKVVRDAYVFGVIALLLAAFMIALMVAAIRSNNQRTSVILNFISVSNILISCFAFYIGFGLIFANGTNGCSYTDNIENYGKGENDNFEISYFPKEINDQMTVVRYTYYCKAIDTHNQDIYLEVKFDDAETMEHYLLCAKESFADSGYIEYPNPYDLSYIDIIKDSLLISSSSKGDFASCIQFEGSEEYKYVYMKYHSISYSFEQLTIIYNYTNMSSDIEIGNDPDAGKYYPTYLERFGVQHDQKNNFEYRYSED